MRIIVVNSRESSENHVLGACRRAGRYERDDHPVGPPEAVWNLSIGVYLRE
jgi:hypothetical protein